MSLPHVLLGLLVRGPASGWDLSTRLDRDPATGWNAELSQIYPALRRLLRGGFVSMKRRRSTKGPARCEYRLTPAGRKEFEDWLAEPPELVSVRSTALARLAFLERAPAEKRLEWLRSYRGLLTTHLRSAAPGTSAARRRHRVLLETEILWVDREIAAILEQAPTGGEAP